MSQSHPSKSSRRAIKSYAKGLFFIAILVGVAILARKLGVADALDTHWIDAHVRGKGLAGWLTFAGASAVLMAVGLPRQIPAFLGGYALGLVYGSIVALAATCGGLIINFLFARFMGREVVLNRLGKRIAKADAFFSHAPFTMALVIRLMPVGSNLLTNLIAGVTSIRLLPFLLGSLLGYAPQTIIFALLGSGVRVDPGLRITAGVVGFVAATWLGLTVYRRYRNARLLAEDVNGQD